MLQRPQRTLALVAAATVALTVGGATAATISATASPVQAAASGTHTAPAPRVTTLAKDFVLPLQLSVSSSRGILVSDSGASLLRRIGQKKPVVVGPKGGEVTGVDVDRWGNLAYTTGNPKTHRSTLTIVRHGHKPVVADLSGYEAKHNPDHGISYGIDGKVDSCVAKALKAGQIPTRYRGQVDSHPYAVAAVPGGWVVADAAGNDLLHVDYRGRISVVAVLPRQPHTFTAAEAAALKLPGCVKGVTYNFEAVPTDVEYRGGALYVTTLPGGPEGPELGARGSVYKVLLRSHHVHRIATGFAGATNLALTPGGTILVAEFFAGRISKVYAGSARPVLKLPGVSGIESYRNALYATTAQLGPQGPAGAGTVVRIDYRW